MQASPKQIECELDPAVPSHSTVRHAGWSNSALAYVSHATTWKLWCDWWLLHRPGPCHHTCPRSPSPLGWPGQLMMAARSHALGSWASSAFLTLCDSGPGVVGRRSTALKSCSFSPPQSDKDPTQSQESFKMIRNGFLALISSSRTSCVFEYHSFKNISSRYKSSLTFAYDLIC